MSDITVVIHPIPGKGICSICGNGLWPWQKPCEHKKGKT